MYIYEGLLMRQKDGMFVAVILKLTHDEPNCDTVAEHVTYNEEEAHIWLDDEMSRLECGKGVWDV
jgi:hypothetical protein